MAGLKLAAPLAALLLLSCSGGKPSKPESSPPEIQLSGAWARATLPNQDTGVAYLQIANAGGSADKMTGASTDIGTATLHSTSMEGGIMRMRPLAALDLPAHSTVTLQPGGTHIMITGLKSPLREKDHFGLSLTFEHSPAQSVQVEVRPAGASGMAM